jgi:hypothetical protein
VARYDAEYGSPAATPPAQLFEAERIRPDRRRPNWTAAMVAAIAVVIAFVGFNLVKGGDSGEPSAASSPSSPTSAAPKPPESKTGTGGGPAPTESAIAAAPSDKVTVKLTATDKSWISATDSNGKSLFQSVLASGESRTFDDDKQIRLIIGDAGAVSMFVNGKDLGPAGERGQVVRLNFTPGDPEAG